MKKILSLFLALALLLCPTVTSASAASTNFTDVPADSWFADAVEYASGQGLFSGYTDNTFRPDVAMDRGMFVTVLGRLANVDQSLYKKSYFYDVKTTDYFSPYVQWAASYEIVAGMGEYTYSPKKPVQRQQIAALLYRFAEATGNDLSVTAGALDGFSDKGSVSSYAKTAMEWAVSHGVINGSNGKLNPLGSAKRKEVAQIFYNLHSLGLFPSVEITRDPIKLPEPPAKPVSTFKAPTNISTTLNGVYLSGVELDPTCYKIFPVLANNKLYSSQSASTLARSNGAYVAVNGAFFQSYSDKANYLANWSTIIKNGECLRTENPKAGKDPKPAFVVDSQGKASIESFKTVRNVLLVRDGQTLDTLKEVGCNMATAANDATPMIYTAAFGKSSVISGKVARAAAADKNGVVTQVYPNGGTNLAIPKEGFLLVEKVLRWEGEKFLLTCQKGDTLKLDVTYQGSRTQDIVSALSNGPTLVKNGVARTQRADYVKEGFEDAYIIDGSNTRMAIGVKQNGNVVIVSASSTLAGLAGAMKSLGCKDAMLLDGGASRFLYVNGGERIPAGRALNNMLIFQKK